MKSTGLWISGVIFLAIAILHILRYIEGWSLIIGGYPIPVEWSMYVAIVFVILALWIFSTAKD